MQDNRRVYPREGFPAKWLSYLLLFLSAVVLLGGLVWREDGELSIEVSQTPTPIPTGESFDETSESRELTLPSATWYALQLGVFESESAAEELAQRFAKRGAAGYVWADGRFRTLAAIYPTSEEAQNVRRQLSERHTVESYLYQIELSGPQIRMRGMRGQLEIFEAAFLHANDLVAGLQQASVLMDRQELTVAEALERFSALRAQTDTVSLRLKQRFSAPRHPTVQGLIDCFDAYAAFCDTLSQSVDAVTLATLSKREAIASLYALKAVYHELGNT